MSCAVGEQEETLCIMVSAIWPPTEAVFCQSYENSWSACFIMAPQTAAENVLWVKLKTSLCCKFLFFKLLFQIYFKQVNYKEKLSFSTEMILYYTILFINIEMKYGGCFVLFCFSSSLCWQSLAKPHAFNVSINLNLHFSVKVLSAEKYVVY